MVRKIREKVASVFTGLYFRFFWQLIIAFIVFVMIAGITGSYFIVSIDNHQKTRLDDVKLRSHHATVAGLYATIARIRYVARHDKIHKLIAYFEWAFLYLDQYFYNAKSFPLFRKDRFQDMGIYRKV